MNNPEKNINPFSRLSDELLVEILSYISKDHFLNIRLVDQRFNRIFNDASLWKKVRIFEMSNNAILINKVLHI